MALKVQPGEGTLLQVDLAHRPPAVDTTPTWTLVGQRVEIEGPDVKIDAIETTTLDSTRKQFRQITLPEDGKLTLTIYYDPTDATLAHHLLQGEWLAPTGSYWYSLVFNTAAPGSREGVIFSAFVSGFKPTGMKVGENLSADVELTLDGGAAPVFAATY